MSNIDILIYIYTYSLQTFLIGIAVRRHMNHRTLFASRASFRSVGSRMHTQRGTTGEYDPTSPASKTSPNRRVRLVEMLGCRRVRKDSIKKIELRI